MFHIHRSLCHQFGRSIRLHQRCAGSTNSPDYEIVGRLADKSTNRYKAGQLFLHRVFAYRGIIVCSFDCKEFGRKDEAHFETTPYYQVLVHRGDWGTMRFSTDTTTYLTDHTSRDGNKQLSIIYGMDCVPHADVLPLSLLPPSGEFKPPIEHDLFKRLFQLADQQHPELGFNLVQELGRQRSWLSPQSTHIETTESIRVMITTYYLGTTSVNAHNAKHCWRYVVRLENLDDQSMLLRERHIKVFSLNNLTQASGGGVVGEVPRLTREYPAFQFSSVVDVNQRKGGHMWGKLKLERDDGSVFDVNLPTVLLETNAETGSNRVNENLVQ